MWVLDPRPGRVPIHAVIVAGSHPRMVPMVASGAGSRARDSESGSIPIMCATSRRDR
jgi:hypothetical protein